MKQALLRALPTRAYLGLRRWDFRRSRTTRFLQLQEMRRRVTTDGYSYKPFDDARCIFVHIPKCAGQSIKRALFGNLAGGHTTLEEYLTIFEASSLLRYFKFTVARNPWDRLVSAYFYLKKGGFGERDRDWFERELGHLHGFDDFVRNWLDRKNMWKWYHLRPQYSYMLDKRQKLKLDFVAFVENIDADFQTITRTLGASCILPASNKSEHASYMSYYDRETREIVARVYAEDIALLGYTFDNSSVPGQVAARDAGKVFSLARQPSRDGTGT